MQLARAFGAVRHPPRPLRSGAPRYWDAAGRCRQALALGEASLQNSNGGLRDAKAQRCNLNRHNPFDSSTCDLPEPRWLSFSFYFQVLTGLHRGRERWPVRLALELILMDHLGLHAND